jgi:hypothetical protein
MLRLLLFSLPCFVAGAGSAVDLVLFVAAGPFDPALADLVVRAAAFDERSTVVLETFLELFSFLFLARFAF